MNKGLHPIGVRNIMKEVLLTAHNDGTALAKRFANSSLCEEICNALGVNYREYRIDLEKRVVQKGMSTHRAQIKSVEPDRVVVPGGQMLLFPD